ncbi:hypothetical protein BASA81_012619 [Batrachochytrium salamandrivorans]|nr:hypothetical protein BASA81_012619 [Batrachochytrium salamandrivorans]
MPLEATVVCLDGSEFMRNGDYAPNRLDAMKDCASLLVDAKFAMNPESSVGVVASGFALGPKSLCSCSPADSAINPLNACSSLAIQNTGSDFPFCASLQVAALTLKHRRNKNGQARVVLFCGSPIADSEEQMVKTAKNLKKNNIAVDVVSLGEQDANEAKLQAFFSAVQKGNLCSLVVCPPGVLVSDVVTNSPIFQGTPEEGEEGVPRPHVGGMGAGASFAEYGGVDPSLDPEMALALRASMEEERARLANLALGDPAVVTAPPPAVVETVASVQADDEEEAMLAEAILLSMKGEGGGEEEEDEDDEARQLALAMAMSQEEEEEGAQAGKEEEKPFLDPQYVNQLLEGLEGIDKNDPAIQALLQQQPPEPNAKKPRKEDQEEN